MYNRDNYDLPIWIYVSIPRNIMFLHILLTSEPAVLKLPTENIQITVANQGYQGVDKGYQGVWYSGSAL